MLEENLIGRWDGRECILELQQADYQWKQMEWIGWYFEYKAFDVLRSRLGGDIGPSYDRMHFDYLRNGFVWDFKAHITNASSHPWAILNDWEAVDQCARHYGDIGFIIASGQADYDDTEQSFKTWHDVLKGGSSSYERERIARGAPSRARKTAFNLERFYVVCLTPDALEQGVNEGWLGDFQSGMRNADGSSRRSKYMLNLKELPDSLVIGCGRTYDQESILL